VMSALPPKADIRPRDQDVCFVPKADISLPWTDSQRALDPAAHSPHPHADIANALSISNAQIKRDV
jgi:hypothetical protein